MDTAAPAAMRQLRIVWRRLGAGRVWCLVGIVGAASGAVWAFDLHSFAPLGARAGISLPWWGLALAFYLAEAWVVHLQFRKQAHTLSLMEVGLVLGLCFTSPAALLTAQVVGSGLALAVQRRQKPVKLAFNVAELTLGSGVALLIFRSLADVGTTGVRLWAAALLACAAAHVIGVLLVSLVIAAAEGTMAAPQLPRTLAVSLFGALATACLGLVGVELLVKEPLALLLLAVPAVACALSFRGYLAQREQREHVEFLYESMRATQGAPEFGLAVGQLLVAVRRLLRADYAEILLLPPTPGEPALRSVSGSSGETLMHPEALTPEAEFALETVTAADRSLLLPRRRESHPLDACLAQRGIADAVVGALRGEERVFGILLVGERVGDVSTFAEDDLTLFETFAGHASMLLENGRLEHSLAQVTELKEKLHDQAYHDALTGLPNRVLLAERVSDALARRPVAEATHAVLFLDLDRFKIVNDSWGHAVGDELLVHVAERIRSAVRPADTPARLGGDEFAVLLENSDERRAERAAQRMIDALSTPFSVSGREVRVEASIGVALTGPHARTGGELLRNADIAMYTAKSDSRRRYSFYEPVLHDRLRLRHKRALELERAVEQGDIVVHYQPVVSLSDGTIHAFEALARWRHPEHGLLLPADFLDVAEENGLVGDVTAQVFDQAFRCANEWPDVHPAGATLGLWVNLAPGELARDRLSEDLALALTRARLDVRRLTIEITESTLIDDEQGALKAMQRLQELGVRFSIDDFGTGYSSLSRLSQFPIDMLKIPKPFVDQLTRDQAGASFVDAILRLAGSLGLVAVAEGIELPEQARALRNLGCSLGQGHLFSRPLTSGEALDLLGAGSATGATVFPEARDFAA